MKEGNLVTFSSRSQRLAEILLKSIGVKDTIKQAFEEGSILETNSINPLSIFQTEVTDDQIIAELNQKGLMVYHVLVSNQLIGKVVDTETDFETSTYERVVTVKSYLCIPKDLAWDGKLDVELEIIKNYIQNVLSKAKQGYYFAYLVTIDGTEQEYGDICVCTINGSPVRS